MPSSILFPLGKKLLVGTDPNLLGVPPSLRGRMLAMGGGQYLTLFGVTRDSSGVALPNCVVDLFRTIDDVKVDTTPSDANGAYQFRGLAPSLTYYVVAYKAGSPDVAGTTVNTLLGTSNASDAPIIAPSHGPVGIGGSGTGTNPATTCVVPIPATQGTGLVPTSLVAFIANDSFAPTSFGVGSWTRLDANVESHNFCEIWVWPNATAGITSVTITFGGAGNSGAVIQEFYGNVSTAFDDRDTATGSSTAPAAPSVDPANDNYVFAIAVTNDAKTAGPTNGFTALTELAWRSGVRRVLPAYIDQASAVAASTGWTINSAVFWDVGIVAVDRGI